MIKTLVNAWKLPEVRKKIIYTLLLILIFRIGCMIPVPGVDSLQLAEYVESNSNSLVSTLNIISGGALTRLSIFTLSIGPYITASIVVQLLTLAIPALEQMKREGEEGKKKMNRIMKYLTVVLAIFEGFGVFVTYGGSQGIFLLPNYVMIPIFLLTVTAGTAFLTWLGDQITEKGIGNGISLIIFAGIVSRIPNGCLTLYSYIVEKGAIGVLVVLLFAVIALAAIVAVVAIQEGQRRIPVQYAKRVVGRKVYGGQSTHIPIKVNSAGVIPVIFAMSILMFPGTIASFFPNSGFAQTITNIFDASGIFYNILYALLIVFFTYFYSAISFNPVDVAENIKKNGGFIPGLRPGRPTSDYISKVMSRITLFGAIFLAAIAVLPAIIMGLTGLELYFGGTALLIVVGVALDTMKQLEASLLMRSYEGFMK